MDAPQDRFGRQTLRRTLLSRKPAEGAAWAAAYGIAAFMLFHLFYHQDLGGLSAYVASTREQVFGRHEYWRTLTAPLVHADLEHFLSNSVFFAGLAFLLRGYFGVWAFPVLSLAAGAWIQWLALWTYPPGVTLVGASGMVYFMAAFWLALYVGIERRLSLARRLVNSAGFTLALLFPETFKPEVSYRAHLIGYVLGWILGGAYFWFRRGQFRAAEVWEEVVEEDSEDGPEVGPEGDPERRVAL